MLGGALPTAPIQFVCTVFLNAMHSCHVLPLIKRMNLNLQ